MTKPYLSVLRVVIEVFKMNYTIAIILLVLAGYGGGELLRKLIRFIKSIRKGGKPYV